MGETEQELKLINAKRELYYLIVSKRVEELSDAEIELGYILAKDRDMQAILEKARLEG